MQQREIDELKDWTLATTSDQVAKKGTCLLLFESGIMPVLYDKWLH